MTMLELIKQQMSSAVPFAALTGVELLDLSPTESTARLVQRHEVSNHVGTVHAGALYTLAETASGAVMAAIFAEQILAVRPVVSEARISYAKAARGTLVARAKAARSAEELRAELASAGRVVFDVVVGIVDEAGNAVAELVATWNVKKVA